MLALPGQRKSSHARVRDPHLEAISVTGDAVTASFIATTFLDKNGTLANTFAQVRRDESHNVTDPGRKSSPRTSMLSHPPLRAVIVTPSPQWFYRP